MSRFPKFALAVASVAVLAFVTVPGAADAATTGSTFTVTAAVAKVCTVTATNISFAAGYDPNAGSPATAPGTVSLTCTKGVTADVTLSTTSGWKLSDGAGNTLDYKIFQNTSTTAIWDATNKVTATALSKATIPLVGTASIAAGQDVPAGTYTDTVTVTVNY